MNPNDLFDQWANHMINHGVVTQKTSLAVYQDMWNAFTRWYIKEKRTTTFTDLSRTDLLSYIDLRGRLRRSDPKGMPLSSRYIHRLLDLVDRILAYEAQLTDQEPNDVARKLLLSRKAWREAFKGDADLPDYLNPSEAKRLILFLVASCPRDAGECTQDDWRSLRVKASLGLMLGSGVTPGEVRELSTSALVSDGGRRGDLVWKVRVPAIGSSRAREVPVPIWTGRLLAHWIRVRSHEGHAGPYLFPSTRTGKQWSKTIQYTSTRQMLEDAGWSTEDAKGGNYKLRHTFALRHLSKGISEEQVAQWLGISDLTKMTRYKKVLMPSMEQEIE